MTKTELIELMQTMGAKTALEQWTQKMEGDETLDLSGMDLTGIDFTDAVIEDANLSGTTWQDCKVFDLVLIRCNLDNAQWSMNMNGATAIECSLYRGSVTPGVSFRGFSRTGCLGETSLSTGTITRPPRTQSSDRQRLDTDPALQKVIAHPGEIKNQASGTTTRV